MIKRVLIWADLQLHTWEQFGISKDNMSRRMLEQKSILEQITTINKERKIDLAIFAGDWVQIVGDHPTEVVMMTIEYFKKDRTPYMFADGNHDLEDTVTPTWYQNVANMLRALAEKPPEAIKAPSIKIVGFQDKVDYEELKGFDIVVLHKQPELTTDFGHKMKGVDWKKLAKNNGLVFFGHDHTQKKLANNSWVLGAPMHHTFGDVGDRGLFIVEYDAQMEPKVEFIKLQYPEFLTVETEDQVKQDGNYYRVLNASENYREDNVVAVHKPPVFEQRIKSDQFKDILVEWCKINGKDETYLLAIENIIKDKVQAAKEFFTGRIDSVEIDDFLSIEHVEYKLEDGVTFIAGLNGVGKSTATGEAVYWCLFGKTTKELTGNDVVRDDCKDCSVTTRLKGDKSYEIIRSRKKGLEIIDTKTKEDLAEGLREDDKQALLERILGFNEAVFKAACYFSQENLMTLTGLTDDSRTNMITDLLGFETYDDLYEETHKKQKSFEKEREDIVAKKVTIESDIRVLDSKIQGLDSTIESFAKEISDWNLDIRNYHDRLSELTPRLSAIVKQGSAEEEMAKYDGIIKDKESLRDTVRESIEDMTKSTEVAGHNKALTDLTSKASAINTELKEIIKNESRLEKEIASPVVAPDPKYADMISELKSQAGELSGVRYGKEDLVKKLQQEIDNLNGVEVNVRCKKCGSLVTKENVQKFIDERKTEIDMASAIMNDLLVKSKEVADKVDAVVVEQAKEISAGKQRYIAERKYKLGDLRERSEELMKELDGLNAAIIENTKKRDEAAEEKRLFEKKLQKVEQEIQEARRSRDACANRVTEQMQEKLSVENAIENCQNMIKIDNRQINELDVKIQGLKQDVAKIKGQKDVSATQMKEADGGIDVIDKGIAVLEFWKVAFSAKGIRSVLLDKFANEMNGIVNTYLATVTNGLMSVIISPTTSTKKGEERNKIGMVIKKGARERTYKSLSGGQKKRVDVSLCFALNKWVSDKYGVPKGILGLIILDELFSFIDKVGEESIANLIYNEARDKAIIEISHTPELKSYCDRVWTIVMENDISRLEIA
jgi:DNA repair exonuclease SbcCD ATPase subunit